MFIDKKLEKKEQMRQLEYMAKEDKATINRYSAMQPQDMSYQYNSKKTLQRNYRDFEIYQSMKTDAAQRYGKFQKNVDFMKLNKENARTMLLDEQAEHSLEIDKMILHLCENHLLDDSLEVNDVRILTEHLMAGALYSEKNANDAICRTLKNDGIKALEEIYFRELEALSDKYGRDTLINMSPLEYIKALPEIMNDFSCIDDMQKFFATYRNPEDENGQLMEVLKFYADSWKCLQKRYMLILNGEFNGEAYAKYSSEMKNVHTIAKRQKLFGKKKIRQQRKISDFWKTRDERSQMAVKVMCEYNALEALNEKKQQEATKKAEEYAQQAKKINQYSGGETISDEEIQNKVEEIMEEVTCHKEEVTEENVVAMSEEIHRRIGELCKKVSDCSDEELLNEYIDMRLKIESLNREINHMMFADLFVRIRKADPNNKTILPIKTRLSFLTTEYPLFGQLVNIMEKRLEFIQKYGYTNTSNFIDKQDIMEARFGLTEKYEDRSESYERMSVYDAIQIPKFLDRLYNLSNLDFKIINKEIAACRKVKEFREQQPDFYHLGLSYEQHRRAEAMCELLPFYERALELALQYLGIKDSNHDLVEHLKQEWEEAYDLYSQNAYKVDSRTTDSVYYANEMDMSEHMSKLFENKKIWPKGIKDEVKYKIVKAHDFLSDESAEMKKWEIEKVMHVIEYQTQIEKDAKDLSFTKAQFDAFSIMTFKFVNLAEYLNKELEASDYSDYKFFELRKDIYSAGRQAEFLNQFFGNEDIMQELSNMCTAQGHQEMLKEIFNAIPEIVKKINVYGDYTKALNLEYAKRYGIKNMKVDVDGALDFISSDNLLKLAHTYKMNACNEIERLRVKKLTGDNQSAITKQQKERRIRQGVGMEQIASATKTFMANLKMAVDLKSLAGNVVGTPLQLFSWCMHEPRTKDHGVAIYDKCQAQYDEMMQKFGENHPMKTASLPRWQRGDAQCSPEVDLDGLFSSPMKKRIYHLLNAEDNHNLLQSVPEDIMDNEFLGAIKAVKQYATVVGIVNADTTEMEMAFLDMFLKRSMNYLSNNIYSEDEVIRNRCLLLYEIKLDIHNTLNGTLKSTMSEDELREIDEKTISYVESTIYSENMEESNIEDIPLFLHEPNINDVRQSSIGDCWLVSAISAVVRTNPDFIKSMFHDTGDGNVIVRLFAIEKNGTIINSEKSILEDDNVITFPTYFKLRKQYETGWGNACDCTWVQLLEKAYALSGFNGRREMSVKGNKLYNVVDELTYGHHGIALMHLTGKRPDYIEKSSIIKMSERVFYSPELLAAVYDGFTAEQINDICKVIFESIPSKEQWFKNDIEYLSECGALIAEDAEHLNLNLQRVNDNIQKIKRGETLSEHYEEIKAQIVAYKQGKNLPGVILEDLEEQVLIQAGCEYFEIPRNPNYTEKENFFYRKCKKVFEEDKTLSVAIPHCVDLLDAKEHNGKYFILMRDPFNIYNYEYTMDGEQVKVAEEGFTCVLSGNKENRHLTGDAQDIMHYGFRGTSWVELKDIYERVYGIFIPKFDA